ncbi:hypothetical protein BGZ60DRAFT_437824 [Tricladium varicosporioides]|nr:hypothetical protein BGZ60DRAFT_437824 [Hymenoscyphus varicosporioides]
MAAVTQQAPNLPKTPSNYGASRNTSPQNTKKKAPTVTDASEKVQEEAQETKTQTDFEEQTEDGNEAVTENDEEEGIEAVPAGSVDANGDVVDDSGKVIGHVNGETVSHLDGSQLEGSIVDQEGDILDDEGNVIGTASVGEALTEMDPNPVTEAAEGTEKPDLEGSEKPVLEDTENPELDDSQIPESEIGEKPELAAPFGVQDNGEVTNATGQVIGKLAEGTPQDLVGTSIKEIDDEGNLKNKSGSVVGKAELDPEFLNKVGELDDIEGSKLGGLQAPLSEVGDDKEAGSKPGISRLGESELPEGVETEKLESLKGELPEGADVEKPEGLEGEVLKGDDAERDLEDVESEIPEAEAEKLEGVEEELPKGAEAEKGLESVEGEVPDDAEAELPDLSILKGKTVNKAGKIVDEAGNPFGLLVEGEAKKLIGKKCDAEGKIWDDAGKVIGRAELLPEDEREAEPSLPFEDFPDSIVDAKGNIIFEGRIVGKLIEGDAKKLEGKKVDADGDVLDKNGNVLGKAERYQEEEEVPEAPEEIDLSALEGKKVNKAGNVVDDNGKLFGRVIEGDIKKLVGKKCDAQGKIWSDSGKVIGSAELIPMDDRDEKTGAPFEDFPDAILDSKGNVLFEGEIIGKLIEGDPKKLSGKKVDSDGEVVDKIGNVLGKAERWEAPEEPEAEKIDMSALAGKRVNKMGNVVDSHGEIYGRLVEGDPKKLVGKMCDKEGNVWSEGGNIIGRAELVPESERAGEKEGPFSGFSSPTVTKDGKVADSKGTIIGRLIEGDEMKLYGKPVDPDGDVVDANGNTLGRAERWEEEVKEKPKNPISGRKINRDGNVLDDDGDVIGKLTEGEIGKCIGKEIDNDGDIINSKGQTLGHVSLLEDIPPEPEVQPEPEPEPEVEEEDPEEVEKRKQLEIDRKLAGQMAMCLNQSLDKIKPILKMITNETIDVAEKQPKDELDEQKLVDTVRPLIEEGGQILNEANGVIRGLDPDGRIAANAKGKTATREATPEEYALADVLKDLTENVTKTIDQAKKKIAGMPHAKKELNPLWGLLAEPLGQILAAVGLLLAGVLGLVGRLLSGLGLGGLLDNLLGGLGLKGILNGLGLGMVTDALTGKKK